MILKGQFSQELNLYLTPTYPCSYLDKERARSLVALISPKQPNFLELYSELIQNGYRRSGQFVYRPDCQNCQACQAVRVPIETFLPSRTQKKIANRYRQKLQVRVLDMKYRQEHCDLYIQYIQSRHQIESAPKDELELKQEYTDYILRSSVQTRMIEFSENGVVKMVSVVDILEDGVSAVYTYYDTSDPHQSYGVYSILWLIEWAHKLAYSYVYLGYWIKTCHKMNYKTQYQPIEIFKENQWVMFDKKK